MRPAGTFKVRTVLVADPGDDRGRYAAPVGWVDARGDGEWGLALHCGEIDGPTARLFAGCGIVAGSSPAAELAEAEAKFRPMLRALREPS